ncbi:NAD(P)H-dependent oxidoreductase subunit E [Maricaulis sp.]|uniref:NADH-quinone oxidoreductase subunit NuoE family protein n=1 Tax=Maricaulis sp. TaxID=1486257 RepID=UPI003A918A25
MSQTDSETVERICAAHGHRADALIEILHDIQNAQHCVSDEAARIVAASLNLSRAEIQGVRSFYADFSTEPRDPNRIRLCRAEACQSVGADRLAAALDAKGMAHQPVYCLGNCALGPAALVGDTLIGRATAERIDAVHAGMHRDD